MGIKASDQEAIYYLKNPKLIISFHKISSNVNSSLGNVNRSVINFPISEINLNTANKFEKKYKNNNNTEDTTGAKKNKNKLNKKNRKNLDIDSKNSLIKKGNDFFNDDTSSISLVKNPKFNKNKKKDKLLNQNQVFYNIEDKSKIIESNSKDITIDSPITIQELSRKLNIPETEIITYLFLKGIPVTINQLIDISMATNVAINYDFNILEKKEIQDAEFVINKKLYDIEASVKRPPIIAILGHVDHGKTSLLDAILKTNLVKKEYGGITQSINGHEVSYNYESKSYKLIFLDTPGHEAFSSMRMRGASVADIVLLVVAADDGLKPQSIEAIKCILKMKLSYIIVINKIDKNNTHVEKIKEELSQYQIIDKELGGDAIIIKVSALKSQNIDSLLENICLLADIKDLKSDPRQLAKGTILESYLDKKKGIIANVVIQNGTLRVGNFIIAGNISGKVKSIINNNNSRITTAYPSSIVKILGFQIMPPAGVMFECLIDDKQLKRSMYNSLSNNSLINNTSKILNTRVKSTNQNIKQLRLIIKTETQGSLEAIIDAFYKISQSKIQIHIISADSGNISRADVELALTSNSIIIGFNIIPMADIISFAKNNNIILNTFNVIYDLLDYITSYMLDLIDPEYDKNILGKATVKTVFPINKGAVAGCIVNEGRLKKMSNINIYRDNQIVYTGILNSLKRVKEDVDEVFSDHECGVMCNEYILWKKLDIIQSYELIEKNKEL
uniref:Translation initiation factor IF-2, chloroplastic n=1 Tax=Plumaria plumosa TaxID=189642 RepID=A0A4D6WXP9_9FLOR|nr:Translation initiation factor 2 [Plumaria plumosa]